MAGLKLDHEEVFRLFQAGWKRSAIASRFAVDRTAITYVLKKFGVKPQHHSKITKATKQQIVDLYTSGTSVPILQVQFCLPQKTISRILRGYGATMKPLWQVHRKYRLRDDAFRQAEMEEAAAYWVGFLMADGCVSLSDGESPRIRLALAIKDGSHVEEFRQFLGTNRPLYQKKAFWKKTLDRSGKERWSHSGPGIELSVNSPIMAGDLARYGVVPNKTHRACVSLLDDNRHFFRGLVDGDGSLGLIEQQGKYYPQDRYYPTIKLTGCHLVLDQFSRFVARHIGGSVPTVEDLGGHSETRVAGLRALRLITLLYDNCTVALKRKHEIACRFFREYRLYDGRPVGSKWKPTLSWVTRELLEYGLSQVPSVAELARQLGINNYSLNGVRRRFGIPLPESR